MNSTTTTSKELIRLVCELVKRPSCWDSELDQIELGKFVGDWFREYSIEAEVDEWGNVLVNPDAAVILNGHLDVVAPQGEANYEPKVGGGRIVGRGTSDMKGALAVMMNVMRDLHGKYDLGLVFDVTEEAESAKCGADILCERGVFDGTKFLIVGEPSVNVLVRETHVQVGSEGALDCEVRISTDRTPYHAANIHLANSAIIVAARFIDGLLSNRELTVPLEEFKRTYVPWTVAVGTGPINIGKIAGGTQATLTANRCELQLEKRLFWGETWEEFLVKLEKYASIVDKKTGAKIDVEATWHSDPFLIEEGSPLRTFLKAWTGEKKMKVSFGNGVSDLNKIFNYIWKKKRRILPCLNLGPGNFPVIHTDREFVVVRDLTRFYRLYVDLINEIFEGRARAAIQARRC